jgi:hypothetical protein
MQTVCQVCLPAGPAVLACFKRKSGADPMALAVDDGALLAQLGAHACKWHAMGSAQQVGRVDQALRHFGQLDALVHRSLAQAGIGFLL